MNQLLQRIRRSHRPLKRATAAVVLAFGGVVLAGGPAVHAADVPIDLPPVNLHLNACFPEPSLPAPPYLGPAIEGALIYDDWIASVVTAMQGCQTLRVPMFGELRIPLADPIMSSEFGARFHPVHRRWLPHTGVDLVDRERRWRVPVLTAGMGTVIATGSYAAYGRSVIIGHGERVATVYAHLSSINVRVGDHVDAGDQVGRLGSTGAVTGAHLHFELRLSGAAVDPLDYVAPWPQPPQGHF